MYDDVDIPEPETFNDDYSTRSDAARQQRMAIEDLTPNDVKGPFPTGLTPAQLKHWKYERYIKDYLRCIASVDDNVGRLLDYLDAHGLAENTIVVYTSDQGFYLGDHGWFDKRFMYEESLRMPLIVRYPGHTAPGTTCDLFVQNVDFAPTFLDYARAPIPANIQGVSARPLVEGKKPEGWRTAIYYHYFEEWTEHNVAAHFGIRTDRYKLIHFCSRVQAWELYDLQKDPHELNNVYANPAYASTVTELTAELTKMRERYGDTIDKMEAPKKPTPKPPASRPGETPAKPEPKPDAKP
jgi:arylsulfatase A-like enzyme